MKKKREYSIYDDIRVGPIPPTVEAFTKFVYKKNFESDFGFYPISRADWYVRPFKIEGGDEGREKLKQELIKIGFFNYNENEDLSKKFPPKLPKSKELMDKICC